MGYHKPPPWAPAESWRRYHCKWAAIFAIAQKEIEAMSGAVCEKFMACGMHTNDGTIPKCERQDCPGKRAATFAKFTTRRDLPPPEAPPQS